MAEKPLDDLRSICKNALHEYAMSGGTLQQYLDRLEYELDVIEAVDMANYFLLVKQCVDYVRMRQVPIDARGSACGSLVLFLMGVTQIDPLIWGTDFDRFMARDRLSSPDVDIDISDRGRWVIIEYLDALKINGIKYKTSHIGTYSSLGQAENDNNDTGSAFNTYISSLKKRYMAEAWEEEKALAERDERKPVRKTADANGAIRWNMSADSKIKTLSDVEKLHPKDYDGLQKIVNMRSVYRGRGKHAGGILISAEEVDIDKFVPTMLIAGSGSSADSIVSQYTMKDVEQFGLIKMDWLGGTTLAVMSKCMEFLGRDKTDFSWIPNDDPEVLKYVANRQNHVGIFHLERYPKSIAMEELKPTSTAEFMIHQAYSMPGAADSGAKKIYLANRKAKGKLEYEYEHESLHRIFDPTLGVMLFQEQVLDVCRAVGMVGTELTEFFSIVKDSGAGAVERNRVRLEHGRIRFVELAEAAGMTSKEINWVWQQMVAMGGYAFNRAHAAGYGVRSYRTAYLKFYHPVEYMAALLYCWAGTSTKEKVRGGEVKKDMHYMRTAKKMGIRILPVSVTKSQARPTVEGNAIRKGWINVDGIGEKVANKVEAGMPYTDLRDFAERARVNGSVPYLKNGTMGSLLEKLELTDVFDWEK
jgi:DNA polymerase-3 subunit alpha